MNSSNEYNYFKDNSKSSTSSSTFSSRSDKDRQKEDDFSEFLKEKRENPFIFDGSDVKLKEFCVSFLYVTTGDKLSRKTISKILQLINGILPSSSRIPNNYNQLLKIINPDGNSMLKACKVCSKPSENEICDSESCQNDKKKTTIIKKYIQNISQPVAIVFDFKSQLKKLILKEYGTIVDYKSKNLMILIL